MVFREKPIEWTLVVTNKTSSFLHLSIGTSATGKTYNGEVGSQIYNNLTTNLLAPGEQNALTYKVERWFPADKKVGDHVEILAVIRNVETGEWKFGQAGSDFVQSTNDIRIRDNPALIQEFLQAAGTEDGNSMKNDDNP